MIFFPDPCGDDRGGDEPGKEDYDNHKDPEERGRLFGSVERRLHEFTIFLLRRNSSLRRIYQEDLGQRDGSPHRDKQRHSRHCPQGLKYFFPAERGCGPSVNVNS